MIPRLQAFYGGSPAAWWDLPVGLLRSFVAMLPRLRAERALQGVSEVMIGTGSMERRDAERTLGDWRRMVEVQDDAPRLSEGERRELYASSGFFDVEVVPGG